MKQYLLLLINCTLFTGAVYAQKSKFEKVNFTFYQYPRIALPDSLYKTYSVEANLPDYMGGSYVANAINYSGIPLKKILGGGDIQVMFNYPILTEYSKPELLGQTYKTKVGNKDTSYILHYCRGVFRQGYEYKIRNNVNEKEYAMENDFWLLGIQTDQYKTPEEAARQWNVIYKQRISNECASRRRELETKVLSLVNILFHKGSLGGATEVYRMKDADEYPDMDSAFKIAVAAYPLIAAADGYQHTQFNTAIQPAIDIWKRVVSQMEDSRKARVNKKVANYALFNLAHAYFWQGKYSDALACSTLSDENGKRDYWVDGFEKWVADAKNRELANDIVRNKN